MSNASSKIAEPTAVPERGKLQATVSNIPRVPWNPWLAVLFIAIVYFVSQFFGGLVVSIYPWLKHWTTAQANDWLSNSIPAQFMYVLLAEAFMLGAIYLFLKKYRTNFNIIGLIKPRWSDVGYGLLAAPLYFFLLVSGVRAVSHFVPSLNINQTQDIGFSGVHNLAQLALTFISLVVLIPLVEEIMIRGFLYSSLRKGLPKVGAILMTSIIFASAHLPEGGAAGPLYIAALDTFILSLVLIYLRNKTGGLWASITLHGIKNGVAFLALFILKIH